MKSLTILVVAAAFATGSVAVARADAYAEPRSVTVRFADLDPAKFEGASILYHRLTIAARSVCQDLEPNRELARRATYADCLRTALSNAVAKLDLPAVTAVAEAHGLSTAAATIKVAYNK